MKKDKRIADNAGTGNRYLEDLESQSPWSRTCKNRES